MWSEVSVSDLLSSECLLVMWCLLIVCVPLWRLLLVYVFSWRPFDVDFTVFWDKQHKLRGRFDHKRFSLPTFKCKENSPLLFPNLRLCQSIAQRLNFRWMLKWWPLGRWLRWRSGKDLSEREREGGEREMSKEMPKRGITVELQRRIRAMKMRCYRELLRI